MRRAAAMAAAALLSGALAGCGSGGSVSGPAVFAVHCAYCHSLSGHSTPQQQGGDLRNLRFPREQLLELTAEMPPLHGRLTRAELRAVVSYMQSVERRGG